jgi:hypothetical protein
MHGWLSGWRPTSNTTSTCRRSTARAIRGRELKGQSGPAGSNSERTPDLIAEAGFVYQTDWKIDDHPLPIKVRTGRLVCVPYTSELNDAPLMRHHYEGDYYAKICKRQFDQLYREGETNGRLMCIAIHPYIMGRPHRTKYACKSRVAARRAGGAVRDRRARARRMGGSRSGVR